VVANRIVLVHPEFGVYLGNCMGLGFWTLLDTAGQDQAITFNSETEARSHISTWEANSNPDDYSYITVLCEEEYATVMELIKAGLGDILGDMADNIPLIAKAGRC
jgi:hypothetical protein